MWSGNFSAAFDHLMMLIVCVFCSFRLTLLGFVLALVEGLGFVRLVGCCMLSFGQLCFCGRFCGFWVGAVVDTCSELGLFRVACAICFARGLLS